MQNFEVARQINPNALAEAVERGDKSLVPYLEFNTDVHGGWGDLIALIKLGDETRFNKLVNQTRCVEGGNADDYGRQIHAIQILALLKTPAAYRVLYSLLDDTIYPKSRSADEILFTRSQIVMNQLYATVKPLPEGLNFPDGRGKPAAERLLIWKQWFKTNNLVP